MTTGRINQVTILGRFLFRRIDVAGWWTNESTRLTFPARPPKPSSNWLFLLLPKNRDEFGLIFVFDTFYLRGGGEKKTTTTTTTTTDNGAVKLLLATIVVVVLLLLLLLLPVNVRAGRNLAETHQQRQGNKVFKGPRSTLVAGMILLRFDFSSQTAIRNHKHVVLGKPGTSLVVKSALCNP